jgi:hypothetical protein
MAKSANIGLPYNVAEFAALMNKVLGTGILSNAGSEGVDYDSPAYDDYDEMTLEISGDEITLKIRFYTAAYGDDKATKKRAAFDRLKRVHRTIGGTWDKDYGYNMTFTRDYFGGKIELSTPREAACRKVVTAVTEVPEKVIPERIVPARTEETVEWVCDE